MSPVAGSGFRLCLMLAALALTPGVPVIEIDPALVIVPFLPPLPVVGGIACDLGLRLLHRLGLCWDTAPPFPAASRQSGGTERHPRRPEAVLHMHRAGEIHAKMLRTLGQELDLQELAAELARA